MSDNNTDTPKKYEDPRLDPRQVPLLQMFAAQTGKGKLHKIDEVTRTHEELVQRSNKNRDFLDQKEKMMMADQDHYNEVAPHAAVVRTEGTFVSDFGGNTVRYSFLRPADAPTDAILPCIYYIHGGGMLDSSSFYSYYQAWGRLLAMRGMAVFLVDFRNALVPGIRGSEGSSGEVAPYPAGLNDCVSGVQHVHANAKAFGVCPDEIFVAGESGGGNLALATAMRLRDTTLIRGVYALCPYVLGNYPDEKYPSTVQNQGIFLTLDGLGPHLYGIEAYRRQDPCAWPIFAGDNDLNGLPPTMISCNECDPLLDEGLAMYRKLRAAGVLAQARIVVGTCHGAELFFVMPEVSRATADSVSAFVQDTIAHTNKRTARL